MASPPVRMRILKALRLNSEGPPPRFMRAVSTGQQFLSGVCSLEAPWCQGKAQNVLSSESARLVAACGGTMWMSQMGLGEESMQRTKEGGRVCSGVAVDGLEWMYSSR